MPAQWLLWCFSSPHWRPALLLVPVPVLDQQQLPLPLQAME
jgi:hypothetical protein